MAKKKRFKFSTAMIALIASLIIIGVGYFVATAYVVSQFPNGGLPGGGIYGGFYGPTDETAPTWSGQVQSADEAGPGQTITLSVDWADDVSLASAQLFITADTDNWTLSEEMSADLDGTSDTSSFGYEIPEAYATGTTLFWRVKGFDSAGNDATTGTMNFTITDLNAPACKLESDKTEVKIGEKVNLTATCVDENGPITVKFFDDYTNTESDPQTIDSGESASLEYDTEGISSGTIVNWKVIATDSLNNQGETNNKSFTVVEFSTSDNQDPEISDSTYDPLTIREGDSVTIIVKATDNDELASATLFIDGEEYDSISLDGTSDSATFSWYAAKVETYTWSIKVTDAAGNTVETDTLTFDVKAQPELVIDCDPEGKIDAGPWSDCVEGKQTRIAFKCDTTKGTWTIIDTEERDCTEPGLDTTVLIPVAAIIIVIVVAVAAALVMRKSSIKPKKQTATKPPVPQG